MCVPWYNKEVDTRRHPWSNQLYHHCKQCVRSGGPMDSSWPSQNKNVMIPYCRSGGIRSGPGITQSNELQQRPCRTPVGCYDMGVIKGTHDYSIHYLVVHQWPDWNYLWSGSIHQDSHPSRCGVSLLYHGDCLGCPDVHGVYYQDLSDSHDHWVCLWYVTVYNKTPTAALWGVMIYR